MSNVMEQIVAGYLKTKDRRALAELLAHRRKLLSRLEAVSGIDPASSVQAVQDDLAIIEAGIEELKPPAGTLPENEF